MLTHISVSSFRGKGLSERTDIEEYVAGCDGPFYWLKLLYESLKESEQDSEQQRMRHFNLNELNEL